MKRFILILALLFGAAPALHAQVFRFEPRRAWLGFSFDREEERRPGEVTLTLKVTSVVDESPAERAGLEGGDAILRINGLNATEQLLNTLGTSLEPGDTVTFRIRRAGREQDVRIVAAEPPRGSREPWQRREMLLDSAQRYLRIYIDSAAAGADPLYLRGMGLPRGDTVMIRQFMRGDSALRRMRIWRDSSYAGSDSSRLRIFSRGFLEADTLLLHGDSTHRLSIEFAEELPGRDLIVRNVSIGSRAVGGAELQALNEELARYFDVDAGVLVVNVPENTPARRAGLRGGDVITGVAGAPVRSVPELRRAIDRAAGQEARIDYVRAGRKATLQLKK